MGATKSELTTNEFSKLTGIPASTIAKMVRTGKLEGTKVKGRWLIPRSQLEADVVKAQSESGATSVSVASGSAKESRPSGSYFTVPEFSARTYLTEAGIERWLMSERLMGKRDAKGRWQVDRRNLELPQIKHLIRKS
jgi:excisionase family DNA binding protein